MTQYFVHYDSTTGQIKGFSQNNPDNTALEITHEDYAEFVTGNKRMHEYIVAYAENAEGEDVLTLMFNANNRQTINNVRLRWLVKTTSDTTSLKVKWDLEKREWRFLMTEYGKDTPSITTVPSMFYVVDRDNIDLLVRTIVVDYEQICDGTEFVVPFETAHEENIDQLMIAVRSRFKNFGLEIV